MVSWGLLRDVPLHPAAGPARCRRPSPDLRHPSACGRGDPRDAARCPGLRVGSPEQWHGARPVAQLLLTRYELPSVLSGSSSSSGSLHIFSWKRCLRMPGGRSSGDCRRGSSRPGLGAPRRCDRALAPGPSTADFMGKVKPKASILPQPFPPRRRPLPPPRSGR